MAYKALLTWFLCCYFLLLTKAGSTGLRAFVQAIFFAQRASKGCLFFSLKPQLKLSP